MDQELKLALFRVLPFLGVMIGLLVAWKRKKVAATDLYLNRPRSAKVFFAWWLLFCVYLFITEFTLYSFGLLQISPWKGSFLSSVIRIFGMVVLAPIAEELVFRGLLLHKLTQWRMNRHLAILLQALIFLAVHSAAFHFTLNANIGKVQIFLDAILFAYAKYHTRSIYTPMAMHATGNLVAVLEHTF